MKRSEDETTTEFEHVLMNNYKSDIVKYMSDHPDKFEEALLLALSDKPQSWRAAWLLWSCMEKNDPRVHGHVPDIIHHLSVKKDNHKRELLKILDHMVIDPQYDGLLFDVSVSIWEKTSKIPSVRFNAFKMILRIARKYPDLFHEVELLTDNHYLDSLSPAVRKSVRKMIKQMRD